MNNRIKLAKNFSKKSIKNSFLAIFCLILASLILYPNSVFANNDLKLGNISYKLVSNSNQRTYGEEIVKMLSPEAVFFNASQVYRDRLPEANEIQVAYTANITFTAYNSEVGQCDATPCITANGFNVCKHDKEDTIAMNGVKFGTRIRIPGIFGDRVFVVRDRMNARYGSNRADIWMKDKTIAKKFGVKTARVEFLE